MANCTKFKFVFIASLSSEAWISFPNVFQAGDAWNCQEISSIFKNGSFVVQVLASLEVFPIFWSEGKEFLLQKNAQRRVQYMGSVLSL